MMDQEQPRRPHDCCNVPANMKVETPRPTLRIEVCQVCGAKHYLMFVEPIQIGIEGGKL